MGLRSCKRSDSALYQESRTMHVSKTTNIIVPQLIDAQHWRRITQRMRVNEAFDCNAV